MHAPDLLLIIDPQNDFCDLPPHTVAAEGGAPLTARPALPVAGADADMQRLAAWIEAHGAQLDAITVTLDSHQRFDIAHPDCWRTAEGHAVAPFTPITAQDVQAGRFHTANALHQPRALAYLDALEACGRYTHMVWPVHCELGTWGHGIHASVLGALDRWQTQRLRAVEHVIKGTNPWTEHYSALQAEVPDPGDPSTGLNQRLLQQVRQAGRVIVAGEASSHCVRNTVEDLLDHLPQEAAARFVLLTDCMSPVAGFEAQHEAFLAAARAQGVTLQDSLSFRP